MAIKKNNIELFTARFKNFGIDVQNTASKLWNVATMGVLGDAQRKAPVASGALQGSGATLKAIITPQGIESALIFKVDYAKELNDPKSEKRLKEVGELSYMVDGTRVNKRVKGELGFATNAKNENKDLFVELTKRVISKAFMSI